MVTVRVRVRVRVRVVRARVRADRVVRHAPIETPWDDSRVGERSHEHGARY